jgi:hypothetical protein
LFDETERENSDESASQLVTSTLNLQVMSLLRALVGSVNVLWILQLSVVAQPATIPFEDCFTALNVTQKSQISTVYAQVLDGHRLNFTVLGNSIVPIIAASNDTENPVASESAVVWHPIIDVILH